LNKLITDKIRNIFNANKGELENLKNIAKNDPWVPTFHIYPECGLLNDANGLCHYNGEYHVFYQWFPFAPIHGLKHWAHVKSKDLVHWERMPVAIVPTEKYESHGAYSGNGIVKDDNVYLYYTGNVKYSESERSANQCLAIMNKEYSIEKSVNNPLIEGVPDGYTGHVRDPKVWKAEDGRYYMLLGAQRENLTGTFIIYESDNAVDWNLKGELKTPLTNFGFMWECPNYIKIGDKDIFIFSPQGIEKTEHSYKNLYNVIYVVGKLDLENLTYEIDYMKELDKGFDFYAPQVFVDDFKRNLMFGWIGMPEVEYPSDKNMWAHCLTIPRELVLENNILKQKPVEELKYLRKDTEEFTGSLNNNSLNIDNSCTAYELEISLSNLNSYKTDLKLFKSENEEFSISFDSNKNIVYINKENFENSFAEEFGATRSCEMKIDKKLKLNIFVDNSIVEIFVNNGEVTFTSRVFPLSSSTNIQLSTCGSLDYVIKKYAFDKGI
jgi:beta-fructofuranosidase